MQTSIPSDTACGILTRQGQGTIDLQVPGTAYALTLACAAVPAGAQVGRRLRGTVRATALKLHHADAGGVFVEPVAGAPRIVQGRVLATDLRTNRILADVVLPMWIDLPDSQAASDFQTGQLVNSHLASGTAFHPA